MIAICMRSLVFWRESVGGLAVVAHVFDHGLRALITGSIVA